MRLEFDGWGDSLCAFDAEMESTGSSECCGAMVAAGSTAGWTSGFGSSLFDSDTLFPFDFFLSDLPGSTFLGYAMTGGSTRRRGGGGVSTTGGASIFSAGFTGGGAVVAAFETITRRSYRTTGGGIATGFIDFGGAASRFFSLFAGAGGARTAVFDACVGIVGGTRGEKMNLRGGGAAASGDSTFPGSGGDSTTGGGSGARRIPIGPGLGGGGGTVTGFTGGLLSGRFDTSITVARSKHTHGSQVRP